MGKIKDKISNFFASDINKLCTVVTAFVLCFMPASTNDDTKDVVHDYNPNNMTAIYRPDVISYSELPMELLAHEYYFYRDISLYSYKKEALNLVNEHKKNHFEYSNGSIVNILEDNVIERIDKYGKKKTYKPGQFAKIYIDDSGLIVWDSLIEYETLSSGGVYQVILPDGELIKKEFDFDYERNTIKGYRLTSSTGESLKFSSVIGGFINEETGQTEEKRVFDWKDENGNVIGYKEYTTEEVIGTYGPHFGTEFGINWYNKKGELVKTCNLMNDYTNRYFGTIKHEKEGVDKCTWNDGTEVFYETNENIIQSVRYPNGRDLEITDKEVVIKENGEKIGTLNITEPVRSTPQCNLIYSVNGGYFIFVNGEYYHVHYNNHMCTKMDKYDGQNVTIPEKDSEGIEHTYLLFIGDKHPDKTTEIEDDPNKWIMEVLGVKR